MGFLGLQIFRSQHLVVARIDESELLLLKVVDVFDSGRRVEGFIEVASCRLHIQMAPEVPLLVGFLHHCVLQYHPVVLLSGRILLLGEIVMMMMRVFWAAKAHVHGEALREALVLHCEHRLAVGGRMAWSIRPSDSDALAHERHVKGLALRRGLLGVDHAALVWVSTLGLHVSSGSGAMRLQTASGLVHLGER